MPLNHGPRTERSLTTQNPPRHVGSSRAIRLGVAMSLLAVALSAPAIPGPQVISLDPQLAVAVAGTAIPGRVLTVSGRGYRAGLVIELRWDRPSTRLGYVRTTRSGRFTVTVRVPATSSVGVHQVLLRRRGTTRIIARVRVLVRRAPVTPAPPVTAAAPVTPVASAVYGTAINADTKANIQVGGSGRVKVAYRFQASTTSALQSVRFYQRGGSGYSGGNGGAMRISIQPDDGAGRPSGSALASTTYRPGNPGGSWSHYDNVSFPSPATLGQGRVYFVVFENTDGSPSSNFISLNELFIYGGTLTPRQPEFSDAAYGVLDTESGGWAIARGYTAIMDATYADGRHDGMGYYEAMIANWATISGPTQMVRERFTVTGGSRTVRTASVRVRRSGGGSPLTLRLENASGGLIAAADVPAAAVPISSPGGDNGGAVWVTVTFATPYTLANGSAYNLRLSTAAGTTYTTFPLLQGTAGGFQSYMFTDGSGQRTTNGTTWADIYQWSPQDIQFYLSR